MLIRKGQNLSEIQTEVFDIIVGIEEEAQQAMKKKASAKSLVYRRAIEERRKKKELEQQINDELWFEDI